MSKNFGVARSHVPPTRNRQVMVHNGPVASVRVPSANVPLMPAVPSVPVPSETISEGVSCSDNDSHRCCIPGPKGDRGDRGEQGKRGDRGDKGDKGDRGDPGATGPQGQPGPPGAQGQQGDRGDSGKQGDKGDTGPPGAQGQQGAQGPQGIQGPIGYQGPKGDPGCDGGSGVSAYGYIYNISSKNSKIEYNACNATKVKPDPIIFSDFESNCIENISTIRTQNLQNITGLQIKIPGCYEATYHIYAKLQGVTAKFLSVVLEQYNQNAAAWVIIPGSAYYEKIRFDEEQIFIHANVLFHADTDDIISLFNNTKAVLKMAEQLPEADSCQEGINASLTLKLLKHC